MGLLAPLYALAALAIVGPILFHLIKRQPKGQIQFSSLIFLKPSPPSLTRRSRLDNLLLLLLRSLVILLLAIAFARPYFRQASFEANAISGRTVVLVVDTSASMQRTDVWDKALRKAGEVLDSLSPADRVALYTVDAQTRAILSIESLATSDPQDSQAAARQELRQLVPSWQATRLANGLKSIVDELVAATITGETAEAVEQSMVLVSDLHQECGLDELQGFEWPEGLSLDVRQVLPEKLGNARLSSMPGNLESDSEVTKVRIENASDALQTVYGLSWVSAAGDVISQNNVQIPPGQTRVISMGEAPANAHRVMLTGDSWEADNVSYLMRRQEVVQQVVFVGDASLPDAERLDYFLEKVPLDAGPLTRQLVITQASQLPAALGNPQAVAAIVEPSAEVLANADRLLEFAESGGIVMICLAREMSNGDPAAASVEPLLQRVLATPDVSVREAAKRDFALLANVDYKHPLFAPFADPRFNDFSKLRFWSHRNIRLPKGTETQSLEALETASSDMPAVEASEVRVVAALDDGSPLLLERVAGKGRVWVISAGWHPEGSGLALSSKFVPILRGILDPHDATAQWKDAYEVGELVPAAAGRQWNILGDAAEDATQPVGLVEANGIRFQKPGLYTISDGESERQLMVSVPLSESRQLPMDRDAVEQFGVKTATLESDLVRQASAEQLKVEQLEGRQRLWQWLIAAGMLVLAVESMVAAMKSRVGRREAALQA